jgi:hypothetical protein
VPEVDVMTYGEGTHGLKIQVDDTVGGADYHIFVRQPLPENAFRDTYDRLSEFNASLRFLDTGEPELLTRFILLHEIAHVVLTHSLVTNDRDEKAADKWALDQMPGSTEAPEPALL